jgi:hypothetical protein
MDAKPTMKSRQLASRLISMGIVIAAGALGLAVI